MKVVANSTPLIELSKIKRLDLLRDVYGSIIIPEEVYIKKPKRSIDAEGLF